MAEALLGLGSTGASSLNQELIDKLKAAERKAAVEPIEADIENITADIEKFDEVNQAVLDVLEAIRPFDLFKTEGVNAFEEKSATTSGDSVIFDAADTTSLNNGFTTVNVTQIGQKDVFQSDTIAAANIYDDNGDAVAFTESIGNISITVGDETFEFSTGTATDIEATPPVYGSYDELVKAINDKDGVYASLDEVSSGQYRLIIKSEDVGLDNSISISGDASVKLGYSNDLYTSNTFANSSTIPTTNSEDLVINVDGTDYTINIASKSYSDIQTEINDLSADVNANITDNGDGTFSLDIQNTNGSLISISGAAATTLGLSSERIENSSNHTLTAQDMKLTVDGVSFEASSNEIVVDGLTITANKEGLSTINIQNDTSILETQMQDLVDKYNVLAELVTEATAADSEMYNKSGLKAVVDQIRERIFDTYGANDDKSLFSIGLGFDADLSGKITFDATVFNEAVSNDIEGLKELFIGDAANEGFGTQLKALLDEMFFSSGAVTLFENSLTKREETLNTELEKAEATLDTKYQQLTDQFAMYAAVITQFETAFGGLKMMIDQSIATSN